MHIKDLSKSEENLRLNEINLYKYICFKTRSMYQELMNINVNWKSIKTSPQVKLQNLDLGTLG